MPVQISVRFLPGTVYQNITWGQPVRYTYTTYGEKEICIRARYGNGKILESRTRVRIVPQLPAWTGEEDKADETIILNGTGEHKGGKIQIKYAAFNTKKEKLIRPLIIADESDVLDLFLNGIKADLNYLFKGEFGKVMKEVNQLYDIVYVDNNDSFDDIFRNARLFEEAMIRINAKRENLHDRNYVVGLGMGGLVARYALRDMEKKGLNHDVCKFISLNSPHKGANIPVGLQALLRYLENIKMFKRRVADILEKTKAIRELLEKKAMKQMLVYKVDNNYDYLDEHAAFIQRYESMGMPVLCENIAISNGGYDGKSLESAGSLLLKMAGEIDNFESEVHFLNQKQETELFSGAIKMLFKFKKRKLYSTSDMVALDGAPGSSLLLNSLLKKMGDDIMSTFQLDRFCFVPTVSALALNDWENKLLYWFDLKPSASCFDRIYASKENNKYEQLEACKDFLEKELAPQIEGEQKDIKGETTFTLKNVPSFLPVTWTLSNDNFKIISRSGTKVTVVPLKFNSSSELKVSLPMPDVPSISVPITSLPVEVYGDTYISGQESRYHIYILPDHATLRWRVAEGLEIKSQSGLDVMVKAVGKTTPWIEAIITTRYNTETVIRKDLKCVPLTGARLQYLDSWVGKNDKGDYIKKYAYQLVYEPAEIPLHQLAFCWRSSVEVTKGSNLISPKKATIKTEGNVTSSVFEACFVSDPFIDTDPPVIFPPLFNSADVASSSSLPLGFEIDPDQRPYIWANSTNHATVWMPQINIGGESKGRLFCTVKDFLGNSFSVTSPEELFDQWNTIYHIAPNPANTTLSLSRQNQQNGVSAYSVSIPEPMTIRLFNDFGLSRSVESDSSQPEIQMNVSDLPEGTYYLNVLRDGQVIQRSVVLIRHN